jgi:outer membrane protein assembly factor BamB
MRMLLAALLLGAVPQDGPPPDLGTRKDGADWPGFLGPRRDGTSDERGLPASWPAGGPRLVWHRPLGESYGAPAVARGRLYAFDRHGDRVRLTCLKSETGEELWRYEAPCAYRDGYGAEDGPRCGPVVDDDRVYAFGPEGGLHCVRATDGKPVWTKDTGKEFGVVPNFFGVGSTPVVEGEFLIAMIGGSPPESPPIGSGEVQGAGSGIVAFDKRTGAVRYKITDELASYASPLVATIGGRRWAFAFARGGLVGFEPSSGKVDFHYPWRAPATATVNIANPVVAGDLVLVSEAYGPGSSVLRVRPGGYDVVWSDFRALQAYWNTPIHVDGHLYGAHGQSGMDLRCVEMATGKVKWVERSVRQSSLLRVDGRFVGLGEDGTLRLLKAAPEGCEVLAQVDPKGPDGKPLLEPPCRAAPVLARGLLYVRGRNRLACFELIPPKGP